MAHRIQFWIVILLAAAAIGGTFRYWGLSERIESSRAAELDAHGLDRLWISSQDQLLGFRRDGARVNVWAWSLADGQVLYERAVELPSSDEPGKTAPFAVSPAASRIAFPAAGSVRVENLFGAAQDRPAVRLERRSPLASLAFTGEDRLVLLFRDGRLEVRDLQTKAVAASIQVDVKGLGPLTATGPYVAALSSAAGEVVVYDTSADGKVSLVEYGKYPSASGLILSRTGAIAALTARGVARRSEMLETPGSPRAATPFDDQRYLVAGEFPDLYLLASGEKPLKIAAAPAGSAAIAASASHLAISGPAHSQILRTVRVTAVNPFGYAVPGLLALFLFTGLLRRTPLPAPEAPQAAPAPAAAGETPLVVVQDAPTLPRELIEAVAAGECILWAGAGMSVQAGCFTWERLVRNTLYWAVDEQIIPAGVRESSLRDLDAGKVSPVADRIASGVRGNEAVLNRYLWNQFVQQKSESRVHDLIKDTGFRGLISTNWDILLEKAFPQSAGHVYTSSDRERLANGDLLNEFFLLKLNGALDRPETVVFGPAQYATAVAANPILSSAMLHLFDHRTILFVGSSAEGLLESLTPLAFDRAPRRKHFALMETSEGEWKRASDELASRFQVTILPYRASDTNYPELSRFLGALPEQVRARSVEIMEKRVSTAPRGREGVLLKLLERMKGLEADTEIPGLVAATLDGVLHPESFHIFTRRHSGADLTCSYSSDGSVSDWGIKPSDRLPAILAQARRPVDVSTEFLTDVGDNGSQWLERTGAKMVVPIMGGRERLIGAMVLGPREQGGAYGDADRRLLEAVASQVAVVYEKIWLREDLDHERRGKPAAKPVNLMRQCPECGACYDNDVGACPTDGSTPQVMLPVERTVDGKYRLDRLLGRGGMGAVYEAMDVRLNRKVALKAMLSEIFGHSKALERFQREAQASAKLNHPNIIRIYDFGAIGTQGAYLVMELLDGTTWRSELEHRRWIHAAESADWIDQLLEGAKAAHEAGIIHRDLKPENLFVARTPRGPSVKILDFGLAKMTLRSLSQTPGGALTVADAAIGTFGYMPLEQMTGGKADERSDLYSIGVIIIETLSGRHPSDPQSLEDILRFTLKERYAKSVNVEAIDDLASVLRKAVAMVPAQRFVSIAELQENLMPVLRQIRAEA